VTGTKIFGTKRGLSAREKAGRAGGRPGSSAPLLCPAHCTAPHKDTLAGRLAPPEITEQVTVQCAHTHALHLQSPTQRASTVQEKKALQYGV
jgi:hypothetical protein